MKQNNKKESPASTNKYKLGVFLEAGGNKVFFVNGVLSILDKENIKIDMLVGLSSSAAILFAFLFGKSLYAVNLFAHKLDHNNKNFYLLRKEHFPHNEIYGSSVSHLLEEYPAKEIFSDFLILGSSTPRKWVTFKATLATFFLILKYGFKINLLKYFRDAFDVSEARITNKNILSRAELTSFIMGSSTIFPFIKPHYLNESLILDGGLLDIDYENLLFDCEKKIIIHTEKGQTSTVGNTLHIYSDERIPNNMLDYTNGSKVIWLHKLGENVMSRNISLLKSFIGQAKVYSGGAIPAVL